MTPWLPWAAAAGMFAVMSVAGILSAPSQLPMPAVNLPPVPFVEGMPVAWFGPVSHVWWIDNSPLLLEYGPYSYKALKQHPELVGKIRKFVPEFNTEDMNPSIPTQVVRLEDGRHLVVLHGCRTHDCPAFAATVALETQSGKIYMSETRFVDGTETRRLWGDPEDVIRNLLNSLDRWPSTPPF